MASGRVAQLPKFAVVDVMIALNGRECLASDRYDVKDAFWKSVLNRLNELYPENVSDVRTVNHVKRTWSALRQRVLQRSDNGEQTPASSSDRRVLYLLRLADTYDDAGGVAPSPLGSSIGGASPAPSRFGASVDQSFFGGSFGSSENSVLNKNIEPMIDAMVVCGGRAALSSRKTTTDGKNELKNFWDRVHVVLQFNTKFSGRSVLSYQRAWQNARSMFIKRVQDGTRDFSFLERKALYLLRVLNQQNAGIEITNGAVYDVHDANEDPEFEPLNDNAKVCTVLKTEPLSLEWLNNLARGVCDQSNGQQENDHFGESASTASPPPPPLLRPKPVDAELEHRLILCKIEREKAQTELLKAQHRLVMAQLRNLDKTGVDSNFNFLDF